MKTRPRVDLAILAVLESGPLHGYAIWETIRNYQIHLIRQHSHLYPKLIALKDDGCLTMHETQHGDAVLMVYTLTLHGHDHLKDLRTDLQASLWVLNSAVQIDTSRSRRAASPAPSPKALLIPPGP